MQKIYETEGIFQSKQCFSNIKLIQTDTQKVQIYKKTILVSIRKLEKHSNKKLL